MSKANRKDSGGGKPPTDRIRRGELCAIGISFVCMLFTGAVAVYARMQARELREQRNEMQEQLELDQRAWVSVKGIELVKAQPGDSGRVRVHFTNSGKTPATQVRTSCMVQLAANERALWKSSLGDNPTVIAPGGDVFCSVTLKASTNPATLKALKAGALQQYVYGVVSYRDIFGKDHWISYCQQRVFADPSDWVYCVRGNGTGEGRPASPWGISH